MTKPKHPIWAALALLLALGPGALAQQGTNITASSTDCTTANSCVTQAVSQTQGAAGIVVTGTHVSTLQFEGSARLDNTRAYTAWAALNCYPPNSTTAATSTTSTGTWQCNVSGLIAVRVRASAYTSGTAVVSIHVNQGSARSIGSGGAALGSEASGFTPGLIPIIGTGPVWAQDSLFSYDDVARMLGVGIATPLAKMHGKGTGTVELRLETSHATQKDVYVTLYNVNGRSWAWGMGIPTNTSPTFGVSRYVSGVYQDTPLTIANDTGLISTAQDVKFGDRAIGPDCGTFADQDTTPSVAAGNCWKTANTMATTITALDDCSNGQVVMVLVDDTLTTWSQASTIILQSSGSLTTTSSDVLVFECDGTSAHQIGLSQSQIQNPAAIITDMLPNTDNSIDLGSGAKRWAEIHGTSITGALTGNASTATALAANGANCSAGNYPLGVDASGAVESCTAAGGTQVFTSFVADTVATNTIEYFAPWNSTASNATESARDATIPTAITITKLCVETSTAQPAAGSLVVTLRSDASSITDIEVTIAAGAAAQTGATIACDTGSSAVAANSLLSIQADNNDTGAVSATIIQLWLEYTR